MQNVKEILAVPLALHKAYETAKADGKIDLADLGLLVDPLVKLPAAVDGASAALEELKALDDTSRADLNQWVKDTYDIADDVLETKVEKGIEVLLHLGEFLGVVGVFKDEPAQ